MCLRPSLKKPLKQVGFKPLETQVEKEKCCKMISMRMSFLIKGGTRMTETTARNDVNRKQKYHSKIKWVLDLEMMRLSLKLPLISKMRIDTQFLILRILTGVDCKTMIVWRIRSKTYILNEERLFEGNEMRHFQQSQRTLSNEFNESLSIVDRTNSLRCSGTFMKRLRQELTLLRWLQANIRKEDTQCMGLKYLYMVGFWALMMSGTGHRFSLWGEKMAKLFTLSHLLSRHLKDLEIRLMS